jgi:hypothetical protein
MNAGVPLLKVLLDDSPRSLKHKFQSIIVPLRCLSVRPSVSAQPSTGTNMFSIEISAYLLAPRIETIHKVLTAVDETRRWKFVRLIIYDHGVAYDSHKCSRATSAHGLLQRHAV